LRVGIYAHPTTIDVEKVGVTIPHLGMFGNAMASFLPPVARALHYKIGHVVVHGPTVLSSGEVLGKKGNHSLSDSTQLWLDKQPGPFVNQIKAFIWDKSLVDAVPDKTQGDTLRAISALFAPPSEYKCIPETTLVIHLRGGDAYRGNRFLLNHGQPPLPYYDLILRSRPWLSVVFVHQGNDMPVLEPLQSLCASLGIEYSSQSGSLKEDLALLLRATIVVAGRGSFMPQVVSLSPCVREVYRYESGFGLALKRSGILIHTVSDTSSMYRSAVLSNNWKNTREQRDLMVNYPTGTMTMVTSLSE
jgi:hypothetical protein